MSLNGERAIGTKLAPDGKAIKKINQQEAYYGAVDILGSPYLTGYEPMFNSSGDVVGIWYVGYSADLNVLGKPLSKSVLKEGFVALRDAKGNIRMHSAHVNDRQVADALQPNDDCRSGTVFALGLRYYNSGVDVRKIGNGSSSVLVV